MKEINKGCEFQSNCIEYKDISYLKIMPICAIHELSIACHDKVNKCKYYTLYNQLQRLKQENAELKEIIKNIQKPIYLPNCPQEITNKYKQTLNAIKEIAENRCWDYTDITCIEFKDKILNLIKESEQ